MPRSPDDWRLGAAIAALIALIGIAAANRHIAGIYHDDGIYLASARSIAENGSYRLIDVPGAPLATKYPPLYPLLLAAVWRVAPDFPGNLALLKAVNALLLAGIGLLAYLWTGRLGYHSQMVRTAAALMTAFSPGLFWFSDMALSEPLFVLLLMGMLVVANERSDSAAETSGQRLFWLGVLGALAALTRTIGVAAIAAAAWHIWRRDGWRKAALVLAPGLVAAGAWIAWCAVAAPQGGYLLDYYLKYEPSIWSRIREAPMVGIRMLALNLRYYALVAPEGLGLPGWALTALAAVLAAMSVRSRADRRRLSLALTLGMFYLAILLGHPLPIERYLAPLIPIVIAAAGLGVTRLMAKRTAGPVAALCLIPFLAADVLWLRQFHEVTLRHIHGHGGRPLPFSWQGFAGVIDWLAKNATPKTAIASPNDTLYFLYTDRPGVRPWPARPELYSPAYDVRDSGPDGARISGDLRRLGVEYLVIDPMLRDGEGKYGRDAIDAVLSRREDGWTEVYRSGDGQHRIYRRTPARE